LQKRWAALCLTLSFTIYVALVPWFILYSSPPSGDQAFYLMVVASLAQDGDLNLRNNYAARDEEKFYSLAPHPPGFVGMGGSGEPSIGTHNAFSTARPPDEWYNFHLPGLPFLVLPAWIIGSWFSMWWPATVVAMCLIGALVALNVFLLAHELTGRSWVAWTVWLPMTFSNPIMSYSYLIFSELPTGLLLIYAFRRLGLGWRSNGPWRRLLVGACIAYIPWLAWRCLPISATLLLYALVQFCRHRRACWTGAAAPQSDDSFEGARDDSRLGSAIPLLLPIALSGLLLARYNLFLFASLLPPDRVPELPDVDPFHWPWAGLDELARFVRTGFALLFDRTFGLLTFAPVYLLAAVGLIAMLRSGRSSDRRLVLWLLLQIIPYATVIMSFEFWNGLWGAPARFQTTLVPLLAAPLAMSIAVLSGGWVGWTYRIIYWSLAVPGLGFMALMVRDARLFWPWDKGAFFAWLAQNPNSPLHLDLRPLLPSYRWDDELNNPLNSGRIIAIALLIFLLGYFLLSVRRRAHGSSQAAVFTPRVLGHGLFCIAALAAGGLGWLAINYDYIKHKTELTQERLWDIQAPLRDPRGIAYLDGKIYIASFGQESIPGEVGEFDLARGSYATVRPVSPQGPLPWVHPGDITAGPDGLLYVLNNGPGEHALYAMKPDGQVLRELSLKGSSPISKGLRVGPDGTLYVAHMSGGSITRYPQDGGEPIMGFRGMAKGLNNPSGLWVERDGTVFTSETYERVQQLDPLDRLMRTYNLDCRPMYFASPPEDGDWLDLTCLDKGLVSINKTRGYLQKATFRDRASAPTAPTGLAYGPDATLFVLQGHTLIAYEVHH
jgi:hypothetical protein